MTVEFDGVERPLPQLQPFLKSADRAVRERAFRAATQPYIEERGALAGLFDRMFELRQRAARNAGFANYRDYIFPAKFRFDYTPADCERFHEAVEATVTPAVARVLEHRRQRLGLEALRPWDLSVDPYRATPLRPFETVDEFVGRARRVFDRVDPVLGGQFQTMIDERLLDLDSRKGKAPGGYCETLHFRGRPFIFMNAVGLVDDVMTLLHEAGSRVPRVRRRTGSRSSGSGIRAPRRRSWRRCPWSCWPRPIWRSPPATSRPRITGAPGSSTSRTCC